MSGERERDDMILKTLTRVDANVSQLLSNDADKERRIRSLERWKWSHAISGAAIAAMLAKLGLPIPGGHG